MNKISISSTEIWKRRPVEYFKDCLKINDKISRKLIPFELNKGQKRIQEAIDRQRNQGKPIRIMVVKYRQGGYSTQAQANLFHCCRFNSGIYMTVSLDLDSSEHIFSITDRFHHYLPASEKRVLKARASNRKELKFDEPHAGRLIIETAGKTAAGHSYTLAGLHLSEVSRWPEDTDDARAGLLNSIPETPNTIIIVESVANGMAGWFYKEWHKPDSMYEKIFVPWFWQEEYSMPLPIAKDKYFASLSEEEKKLATKYELTLEQMEWRRFTLHNKLDDDIQKFQEQYPSNATEAFITSGNSFFNTQAVEAIQVSDPLRGELREIADSSGTESLVFVQSARGTLRIWKRPQKGKEYVIASDVAEGIEIEGAPGDDRHDYSSSDVLDRDTGEQVAQLHGKITPDELGRYMARLGRWYNMAFLCAESNSGYGIHVLDEIVDSGYPQHLLYRQHTLDEQTRRPTTKMGWRTTRANRKSLMSNLDMALRHNEVFVNSADTRDELRSFVTKPDGRIEHGTGHKDDRVFSLAISYEMLGAAPARKTKSDSNVSVMPKVIKYRESIRTAVMR